MEPDSSSEELDPSVIQAPEDICEQSFDLENLFPIHFCVGQKG